MIRTLMLGFAALLLAAGAAVRAQPADDSLVGLWAFEANFGPALRGPLSIAGSGRSWRAAIAGREAEGVEQSGEIRFQFGADGGFRGRLSRDRRTINGFWLQPSGKTEDRSDPGGSGQSFATPTILRRAGAGLWRGTVTPLDDRFTLYLSIFRDPEGVLTGAFRNPELNSNGGASRFQVVRRGDRVRFNLRYDGGEINHEATFLTAPDRLRMQWRDLARPIELTRRSPPEAAAFFPRLPGAPLYAYRAPPSTGDGWRTSAARDVGIDEAMLTEIVRTIAESDPTARPPSLIHSLLVACRGRLVLEEYFFGYDRDTPHDTRSAGKTFASVMLGAAMMRGAGISPDSGIYRCSRRRGPFANPDPRKDRITLAHLMTHSAGLACNDNDDASPGNEGTMQSQRAQPNWWKYTLDLPMAHDPGSRYAYCSANINLVGGALTAATRTWLPEYFERTVARPLQFGRHHWNLDARMAKAISAAASSCGRAICSRSARPIWTAASGTDAGSSPHPGSPASTAPRIEINEATTGYSAEEFGNYYGRGVDALAWHLRP